MSETECSSTPGMPGDLRFGLLGGVNLPEPVETALLDPFSVIIVPEPRETACLYQPGTVRDLPYASKEEIDAKIRDLRENPMYEICIESAQLDDTPFAICGSFATSLLLGEEFGDVDVFAFWPEGWSKDRYLEAVNELAEVLYREAKKMDPAATCSRYNGTLTFTVHRKDIVQLVCTRHRSVEEILRYFDIAICRAALHGGKLMVAPSFEKSRQHKRIVVEPWFVRGPRGAERIVKHAKRYGLAVYDRYLTPEKWAALAKFYHRDALIWHVHHLLYDMTEKKYTQPSNYARQVFSGDNVPQLYDVPDQAFHVHRRVEDTEWYYPSGKGMAEAQKRRRCY